MNSDQIRDILIMVDEVFGKSEHGSHSLSLEPSISHPYLGAKSEYVLCLSIAPLPFHTGFYELVFDNEEITREVLEEVKQVLSTTPTEAVKIR